MPVSLPTAADVRKAREQVARSAVERAEAARTPILAVLGAGDLAVDTVSRRVSTARSQAGDVQQRAAELPQILLRPSEFRRAVSELRAQAEATYSGFAERGEQAWSRIRTQPQVKQVISTIETYTEKLDAQVDVLVDEAHDAAEKALRTVTRQTRSAGEKVAAVAEDAALEAAETVSDLADDAAKAVAKAGAEVSEDITEAGAEAAQDARTAGRKVAERTTPKTPAKAAVKPAVRRTTTGSGPTRS